MMNTIFLKYQHFIETLSSVTKSENRAYIEQAIDPVFFQRTGDKPNNFKTQQIIDTARNSLNLIKNDQPGISLELRVKLIGDLNQALDAYANRISKKVESRWWYFIMRIFGCPKCPATLTALQQKTQSTLLLLNQKKEKKEQKRKRGIQRKVIQQLNIIRADNQKKRSVSVAKACNKWKSFIQTKRVARLQAELHQLKISKAIQTDRRSMLNDLRVRCEQELRKIQKVSDPTEKSIKYPLKESEHYWDKLIDKDNGKLNFIVLSVLSNADLFSMKRISKSTSNLVQAFFDFNKTRLTEEEIALWDGHPHSGKYSYICAQELDEIDHRKEAVKLGISDKVIGTSEKALKTLIEEAEIRRLGFTEEDIEEARKKNGGLRKLFHKGKEAERCLKFCRYLPDGKSILRTIVQKFFPDKENETGFKYRVDNFNLTEESLIQEKQDKEEHEAGSYEKESLRLGGQNLLEAAEEVRNYMGSADGQKITDLTINWISRRDWQNRKATQLDILPIAINLLKGLEYLTIIDCDDPCCKKLPPLNLPNLRSLVIKKTDIEKLPIMHVPNLQACEFRDNLIEVMPNFRGSFDRLTYLIFNDFSGRKLRKWPESAKLPPNLEELSISGSKLRNLPNSIGDLDKLKTLFISQTKGGIGGSMNDSNRHDITSIPPGIMFLKNLKVLRMWQCELTENTPGLEWIALLQNLSKLDLDRNKLVSKCAMFQLLPRHVFW